MVQYFEDRDKNFRLDKNGYVLLSGFLQILKNCINLLFGLIEAHGFSWVLHPKVDIVLVEFVKLCVVSLKKLQRYLLLLLLLLLHFIIDWANSNLEWIID